MCALVIGVQMFFFKQKTAYEVRISDWSSDVCSSDLVGGEATPLYRDLLAATGDAPKWNFHKYLVGRDGKVVATFPSKTTPDDPAVVAAIESAIAAKR